MNSNERNMFYNNEIIADKRVGGWWVGDLITSSLLIFVLSFEFFDRDFYRKLHRDTRVEEKLKRKKLKINQGVTLNCIQSLSHCGTK